MIINPPVIRVLASPVLIAQRTNGEQRRVFSIACGLCGVTIVVDEDGAVGQCGHGFDLCQQDGKTFAVFEKEAR